MAVPMASSAKVVTFRGFTCRIASFRLAGAILLCRFKKMSSIFRGRRSNILCGRRSTSDVWCCAFLRIALSGLQVVATCKFRGRRGVL